MESTFRDYRKVYRSLEDEESKDIYLKRLNFLISNDRVYADKIVRVYLPELGCGYWIEKLRTEVFTRKTVIYGAGLDGKVVMEYCRHYSHNHEIAGSCDRDRAKQESGCLGYPVMSPEALLKDKTLNVLICSKKYEEDIQRFLLENGYPADHIFNVYSLYSGREVKADPGQYFSPDFINYEDDEVFVDAGCFDLGSSLQFKKYCPHVKKIYAFEPDPACYQDCLKAKERSGLEEVEVFPYGLGSRQETMVFQATHNGSSTVSRTGNTTVSIVSLDEIIPQGERVTMIKMDVEGAELEALEGAQKIIQRDKPKLAICIYHKLEDMTAIPLYIKQLVPEYKLYIRHHSNTEGETVLYAVR